MLEVFGILEHVDHKINSIGRGNHGVTVQHLGDVSQASSSVQRGFLVSGLFTKLNNRVDDIGLNAMIFDLIGVLSLVKELFVSLVVL